MGTTIIDGTGSGFEVGVTSDNELKVNASVSVSTGSEQIIFGKSGADFFPLLSTSGTDGGVLRVDSSVSVTTGSEQIIFGKSGTDFFPLLSTSGTDGGILRTTASVTTGSEVFIKGGSVQTFDPIGIGYKDATYTYWVISLHRSCLNEDFRTSCD